MTGELRQIRRRSGSKPSGFGPRQFEFYNLNLQNAVFEDLQADSVRFVFDEAKWATV